MNLTKSFKTEIPNSNSIIPIEYFRLYQYQLVDYFINLCIDHINKNSSINKNYLKLKEIVYGEFDSIYQSINHSELVSYKVNVIIEEEEKEFFKIILPKLINYNNFILNGNLYTPITYIIDYPISIKENSISLNSLFSPITIYFKKNFVKFGGKNLSLEYFTHLFLHDQDDDDIKKIYKFLNFDKTTDIDVVVKQFSKTFKIKSDIKLVKDYITELFFDEYTKYLYDSCYFNDTDTVCFNEIFKQSLIKFINNEVISFIDLNNKRVVFMELLLSPLLQRASSLSHQSRSGHQPVILNIDQYALIKNFNKSKGDSVSQKKQGGLGFHGLSGKTIYDTVNLFSGLLTYKTSMIKPGIENPPKEIAHIHETHFGKICPITVASIDPGEMVSVVPNTKLDTFGRFV